MFVDRGSSLKMMPVQPALEIEELTINASECVIDGDPTRVLPASKVAIEGSSLDGIDQPTTVDRRIGIWLDDDAIGLASAGLAILAAG